MWFLVLFLFYGLVFIVVTWPIHRIWHERTQGGPYDPKFYRRASYWRLYAWIFGGAILATLVYGFLTRG